jgi:hypothetical protein
MRAGARAIPCCSRPNRRNKVSRVASTSSRMARNAPTGAPDQSPSVTARRPASAPLGNVAALPIAGLLGWLVSHTDRRIAATKAIAFQGGELSSTRSESALLAQTSSSMALAGSSGKSTRPMAYARLTDPGLLQCDRRRTGRFHGVHTCTYRCYMISGGAGRPARSSRSILRAHHCDHTQQYGLREGPAPLSEAT